MFLWHFFSIVIVIVILVFFCSFMRVFHLQIFKWIHHTFENQIVKSFDFSRFDHCSSIKSTCIRLMHRNIKDSMDFSVFASTYFATQLPLVKTKWMELCCISFSEPKKKKKNVDFNVFFVLKRKFISNKLMCAPI